MTSIANTQKNLIYSALLLALMAAAYYCRRPASTPEAAPNASTALQTVHIEGEAMGSTYHITYRHPQGANLKTSIDSLLDVFNLSLSTYIDSSDISIFNQGDSVAFRYPFFFPVMARSKEIYELTQGAFNPTVAPLVQAWGFGRKKGLPQRNPNVDSLLKLVDFNSLKYNERGIRKTKPGVQLDFNAIAPGYGVDLVAQLLQARGAQHYMVEIGGEVVCKGQSDKNRPWIIGIDNPLYEEQGGQQMQARIQVQDRGLATSGNYRKFYVKDGKRYAHTIDPKTGYPVQHNLLSATVLANDGMTADAMATAMMVMGKDKAVQLAERLGLEVFLVYDEQGTTKTYTSPKLQSAMLEQ